MDNRNHRFALDFTLTSNTKMCNDKNNNLSVCVATKDWLVGWAYINGSFSMFREGKIAQFLVYCTFWGVLIRKSCSFWEVTENKCKATEYI